jgi:CRISPR-associated protein Cmr2
VRDFAAVPEQDWRRRVLCSLAPRWPAEQEPPPHVPRHERRVPLSAVGWVKRRWRYLPGREGEGFPSTASIASAPYRRAVIEHLGEAEVRRAVKDLAAAERQVRRALDMRGSETRVPGLPPGPDSEAAPWFSRSGGPWVYPERWRPRTLAREAAADRAVQADLERGITAAVNDGLAAARRLGAAMDGLRRRAGAEVPKPPPLASYLAVIVQDLDDMGRFLGGDASDAAGTRIDVSSREHERVSRELLRVAADQRAALRSGALLGVPVYAGGDDLLAFAPAATALKAAEACHGLIPASLPRASTAVLYFHYHASIQQAMREARDLLERAKRQVRGKHALAVGYLRRSGVSAVSIQPWTVDDGRSSAELFGIFGRDAEHRLSPRLVADLERDAGELADLATVPHGPYRAELTRLVRRHTQGEAPGGVRESAGRIAAALAWLGEHEHAPREPGQPAAVRPQNAARVGVFLRQEAR